MDASFIFEKRPIPNDPGLLEAAKSTSNGLVYELDWNYRDDEYMPPECVRGGWKVDGNGKLTGEYGVNPSYREIESSQRELKPYMHDVARNHPDTWVVEVDAEAEDLFPNVPTELQVGWWYVDEDGEITDAFRPNASYQKKRQR